MAIPNYSHGVLKPSRQDPIDPEALCIFENLAEQTQARAEIPLEWFENHDLEKIKEAIRQSLRHAQVMYKDANLRASSLDLVLIVELDTIQLSALKELGSGARLRSS